MTSTHLTMPRRGSASISATDLLKLLSSEGKNGFLRQRRVSKFMKRVKWNHRFVVLAHNAIYIYENEMSKSPNLSIPLLGYIAVEREKSMTCAWVFALVPEVPSLTRRSFACSNDEERKDWMYRIKEHLYTANNVRRMSHPSQIRDKMKSLKDNISPEEEEYLELELPVKTPDEMTSGTKDGSDEKEDVDSNSSSDENEDDESKELKSLPNLCLPSALESEDVEEDPDGLSPPRYSAVLDGQEYHYQNCPANQKAKEWGFEKACMIVDEKINRDRDKCIAMLRGTNKIGTYLIRKSRKENYKVLAILTPDDVVKEFRIEEAFGMYHFLMDACREFPSIDSLLAYYTTYAKVPNLNSFLVWGIHECVDGDGLYEPLDEL